jgi:hypothetical protein
MIEIENIINSNIVLILAGFLILISFVFVWNILIQGKIKKLKKRNEELFAGDKIPNLEGLLMEQAKNIKLLDKDIQELYNISNQINAISQKGFHKVGMVRFNPFKDVGGDQSFAIAFLNGKNNGLVLSSLFTRDGARVYSKSIVNGQSEKYPLTEEEKEAIEQAIGQEKLK